MNSYKEYIKIHDDSAHLISMVPVEELLRFGYEMGLNENSRVLDLCCGYGTVLKIWSEAFGISGVGVDIEGYFIDVGRKRLTEAGIDKVKLVCGDITTYEDDNKYDVVICSETIGTIGETLKRGEKFLKEDGVLAYQKVFSKIPDPPEELVEFDAGVYPLPELNRIFNDLGYYLVAMASDSNGAWERYAVNQCNRGDVNRLREDPSNKDLREDIDYWLNMYFENRRPYEGQAMFGLQRIF